jgi:TonB family protein
MRLDSGRLPLRILLGIALVGFPACSAAAEHANLNDIADRLSAEITTAKIKSVGVADFSAIDGQRSDLDWYLADKLSDALLARSKAFRLLDRGAVPDRKISAAEIASAETLARIGNLWGIEAFITGNVENSGGQYTLTATVRRVADGAVIATESEKIPHERILDLLSPEGTSANQNSKRAGANGVGVPVCTYCPIPQFSDRARRARIHGVSVELNVTVSTTGTVARISVSKGFGYGLTENAIEAASDWKFQPAAGPDGAPVSVIVPVDITFSSSGT